MSSSLTSLMQAHLAADYTTLCCCWRIDTTSGTALGFTNHTRPLVVDGLTYSPINSVDPSTVEQSLGTNVDNLEITSIIDSSMITEEDLLTGKYDYSRVTVFLTNWQDPASYGKKILQSGYIGEIKFQNGQFVAEARSLIQIGSQEVLRYYSPTCRVKRLGFDGCMVNLASNTASTDTGGPHPITQSFSVTTGTAGTGNRKQFNISGANAYDQFFQYGNVTFNSGQNNGLSMEIRSYVQSTGLVTLQENMPHDISAGDSITLVAGCDRLRTTCVNKFNNVVNFQGEPDVPGIDAVLQTPVN